jgi:hypothetical protein
VLVAGKAILTGGTLGRLMARETASSFLVRFLVRFELLLTNASLLIVAVAT